jgi:N6-L-threonylcarbamoyladenine synthase
MQAAESQGATAVRASPRGLTVLGLETSCDETAAAVVRLGPDGRPEVLADEVQSQHEAHAPFGGVVPEIAARAHASRLDGVTARAMAAARIRFEDLDGVAATAGPGLIGGVMVALMTGKAIALAHDLPFLAVNHLEGHALSPRLAHEVAFPYLLLLVSGGHTQLLVVEDVGRYRRLGSTIDDAAGEAFDKLAKVMGLSPATGAAVERAAAQGDPKRFALPRPLLGADHADFSFAGLKTAARRAWEALDAPGAQDRADLAAAFQTAVADVIADRTEKALALLGHGGREQASPPPLEGEGVGGRGEPADAGVRAREATASSASSPNQTRAPHPLAPSPSRGGGIEAPGVTALVAAGGVAANGFIRAALARVAEAAGLPLVVPPLKWCTDNAAMIAFAGALRLARGERDDLKTAARPRWPLDDAAAEAAPAVGGGRKGPKA